MTLQPNRWVWGVALGILAAPVVLLVVVLLARDLMWTRPVVAAFARIVAAGNAGDLATVRSLCTDRYREAHPVGLAPGGGVAGLPRQVHPNFRVWIEGDEVRLCPGNRMGTVYRFIRDGQDWKLDGVVGLLGGDGRVTPMDLQAVPPPN